MFLNLHKLSKAKSKEYNVKPNRGHTFTYSEKLFGWVGFGSIIVCHAPKYNIFFTFVLPPFSTKLDKQLAIDE